MYRTVVSLAVLAAVSFAVPAQAASNGINSLISISQMKARTANEDALRHTNRPTNNRTVSVGANRTFKTRAGHLFMKRQALRR